MEKLILHCIYKAKIIVINEIKQFTLPDSSISKLELFESTLSFNILESSSSASMSAIA